MKASLFTYALIIAGTALLLGCQKDVSALVGESIPESKAAMEKAPQKHQIKGELAGTATAVPIPGDPGLYFTGTVTGRSNMLGKFTSIFNSYFIPGQEVPPFAPLTIFFNPNDYDFLPAGESLSDVSVVSYDKQRNSLWARIFWSNTGTLSGDRYYNQAKYEVVGGTGKFEGATGLYTLTGYYTTPDMTTGASPIAYDIEGELYLPKD